jgi:hypothetical protein
VLTDPLRRVVVVKLAVFEHLLQPDEHRLAVSSSDIAASSSSSRVVVHSWAQRSELRNRASACA